MQWAKERKHWTICEWERTLFNVESKFYLGFGEKGPRVWRRTGEMYRKQCIKRTVQVPQSVMIWGSMSGKGVGKVYHITSTEPALNRVGKCIQYY